MYMADSTLLEQLMDKPGAPFVNWEDIIKQVDEDFPLADTEAKRVALLAVFKATMDIAESNVAAEDIEKFRDARSKHYKSFLVQECLVGEDVCTETMFAVTAREISAGRMSANDSLCQLVEAAMAAPHLTRAELLRKAERPDEFAAQQRESSDRRAWAYRVLDPALYFGFNRLQTILYRITSFIFYRQEKSRALSVKNSLESSQGALTDFERGRLLGVLENLHRTKVISKIMYCMLQSEIQDRKDWE